MSVEGTDIGINGPTRLDSIAFLGMRQIIKPPEPVDGHGGISQLLRRISLLHTHHLQILLQHLFDPRQFLLILPLSIILGT